MALQFFQTNYPQPRAQGRGNNNQMLQMLMMSHALGTLGKAQSLENQKSLASHEALISYTYGNLIASDEFARLAEAQILADLRAQVPGPEDQLDFLNHPFYVYGDTAAMAAGRAAFEFGKTGHDVLSKNLTETEIAAYLAGEQKKIQTLKESYEKSGPQNKYFGQRAAALSTRGEGKDRVLDMEAFRANLFPGTASGNEDLRKGFDQLWGMTHKPTGEQGYVSDLAKGIWNDDWSQVGRGVMAAGEKIGQTLYQETVPWDVSIASDNEIQATLPEEEFQVLAESFGNTTTQSLIDRLWGARRGLLAEFGVKTPGELEPAARTQYSRIQAMEARLLGTPQGSFAMKVQYLDQRMRQVLKPTFRDQDGNIFTESDLPGGRVAGPNDEIVSLINAPAFTELLPRFINNDMADYLEREIGKAGEGGAGKDFPMEAFLRTLSGARAGLPPDQQMDYVGLLQRVASDHKWPVSEEEEWLESEREIAARKIDVSQAGIKAAEAIRQDNRMRFAKIQTVNRKAAGFIAAKRRAEIMIPSLPPPAAKRVRAALAAMPKTLGLPADPQEVLDLGDGYIGNIPLNKTLADIAGIKDRPEVQQPVQDYMRAWASRKPPPDGGMAPGFTPPLGMQEPAMGPSYQRPPPVESKTTGGNGQAAAGPGKSTAKVTFQADDMDKVFAALGNVRYPERGVPA